MLENSKTESELTRKRNSEIYSTLLTLQKRLEDVDREVINSKEKKRTLQVREMRQKGGV